MDIGDLVGFVLRETGEDRREVCRETPKCRCTWILSGLFLCFQCDEIIENLFSLVRDVVVCTVDFWDSRLCREWEDCTCDADDAECQGAERGQCTRSDHDEKLWRLCE